MACDKWRSGLKEVLSTNAEDIGDALNEAHCHPDGAPSIVVDEHGSPLAAIVSMTTAGRLFLEPKDYKTLSEQAVNDRGFRLVRDGLRAPFRVFTTPDDLSRLTVDMAMVVPLAALETLLKTPYGEVAFPAPPTKNRAPINDHKVLQTLDL